MLLNTATVHGPLNAYFPNIPRPTHYPTHTLKQPKNACMKNKKSKCPLAGLLPAKKNKTKQECLWTSLSPHPSAQESHPPPTTLGGQQERIQGTLQEQVAVSSSHSVTRRRGTRTVRSGCPRPSPAHGRAESCVQWFSLWFQSHLSTWESGHHRQANKHLQITKKEANSHFPVRVW